MLLSWFRDRWKCLRNPLCRYYYYVPVLGAGKLHPGRGFWSTRSVKFIMAIAIVILPGKTRKVGQTRRGKIKNVKFNSLIFISSIFHKFIIKAWFRAKKKNPILLLFLHSDRKPQTLRVFYRTNYRLSITDCGITACMN